MPDLDYAKVTGRFALVVGDTTADTDDNPDTVWCTSGRVLITPLTTYVKVASGSPDPFTAGGAVIEATIDSQGYLSYLGKRYLYVVDLTSPKVNPQVPADTATHRVEFIDVMAGDTRVPFPTSTVRLTSGQTNDLTDALPVVPGEATPIYRGPQGTGIQSAEVDGGNLILGLDDGTEVDAGPLPVGPGGSDGGVAGYLGSDTSQTTAAVRQRALDVAAKRSSLFVPNGTYKAGETFTAAGDWWRWVQDGSMAAFNPKDTRIIRIGAVAGTQSYARGQVVLIVDDFHPSHYTVVAPAAEALGGKITIAGASNTINGGGNLSAAQISDLATRGHEIACHSKTHAGMTGLTVAQRIPEWDDSRTAIENIIGAGACTSWVYPGNAANLAVDQEAYGRYDRIFGSQVVTSQPIGDRWDQFSHGRIAWQGDTTDAFYNHPDVLARLRQAAARDEVVVVYTHAVDGSGIPSATVSVTAAQFNEFLALVANLGLQLVTARDAFPAHTPVLNAHALDGLRGWEPSGTAAALANVTLSVVDDDTRSLGIPGTKAFDLTTAAGGASGVGLRMRNWHYLRRPEVPITISARMKQLRTGGAGSYVMSIYEADQYGTSIATTDVPLPGTGGAANTNPATIDWTQVTSAFTPNPLTRAVRVAFQVKTGTYIGSARFKHVHIGPTRLGVLG